MNAKLRLQLSVKSCCDGDRFESFVVSITTIARSRAVVRRIVQEELSQI